MSKQNIPGQPPARWAVHGSVADTAGRAVAGLHVSAERLRIGGPEPLGTLTAVANEDRHRIPFNPIRNQGTCHA